MRYTKPPLSFEQQAQRLIDQNLIVSDKALLLTTLRVVNYYRLSAYWYPFKRTDPATGIESFKPETTFETIWQRYAFDRQLRLLLLSAIEHIEVAILRTRMVAQFTRLHGPFGYADPNNFRPGFAPDNHNRLLNELSDATNNSKEEFVGRFRRKYTGEPLLPLWMVSELMTFGQLFTIFRHLHRPEQQALAASLNLFPPVLESWLLTLNYIRNACAHHARLWNRELPIRPRLPDAKHRPEWYAPVRIFNDRVFAVLTLLCDLLRSIDHTNDWPARFEQLLRAYPGIPLRPMGFPSNWRRCPLWS